MLLFFVWTGASNVGGFSLPDADTVLLILALLLMVVGVAAAFRPVRRACWSRPGGRCARVRVRSVGCSEPGSGRRAPRRVDRHHADLCRRGGLHHPGLRRRLTLPQTGAAYLGAVVIATLAPTPGGLGAFESALIAGLTGFGLASGIAVSATLTFRLATFWLPILPGWFAFGWMQRNQEL